jgi:hypothetical protein
MELTQEQVVQELKNFICGRGAASDWDDFTSIRLKDKALDGVGSICADLPYVFPSDNPGVSCNGGGIAVMHLLIEQLGG